MDHTVNPLNRVVTEAFAEADIPLTAAAKPLAIHPQTARRRYTGGHLTANDLHIAAILLGTSASALQAIAEKQQ